MRCSLVLDPHANTRRAQNRLTLSVAFIAAAILAGGAGHAFGQEDTSSGDAGDQADLAAAAQNPIAAMVSLPFQNNTYFRTGPE